MARFINLYYENKLLHSLEVINVSGAFKMGKSPLADAEISKIWICKKCKARNKAGSEKCRRCGYRYLRPRRKELKAKK